MGEGLSEGHTAPQGEELRPDPGVPQISDCDGYWRVWGVEGFSASQPGNATPFHPSGTTNKASGGPTRTPPMSPFNITTQIKYSNQLLSTGVGGVLKVLEHGDQACNGRDPPDL